MFASSAPDGLEWSLNKVAGAGQPQARGSIHDRAAAIQEKSALLPDYGMTSLSGIVGAAAVVLLCVVCCLVFKFFRRNMHHEENQPGDS